MLLQICFEVVNFRRKLHQKFKMMLLGMNELMLFHALGRLTSNVTLLIIFPALTFGEQPGPSISSDMSGGATGGYDHPSQPTFPPQQPGYPPQHPGYPTEQPMPPQNTGTLNLPQPPSGTHAPPSTPMDANGGNSDAPTGPMNPPEACAWTPPQNTGNLCF
jgi:hypothetical protein